MRRFRNLNRAHKAAWFGAWIVALVGIVSAAQWELGGSNPILTQVLGASAKKPDTTPPVVSISFPTTGAVYGPAGWSGAVTGTATDDSGIASVEVAVMQSGTGMYWNGSTLSASAPMWLAASAKKSDWTLPFVLPVAEGGYTVSVRATDTAISPNRSVPVTASFTVDRTPPGPPSISQQPDSITSSTSATFAFTDGASPVTFECRLDSGSFVACVSPVTYSGLAGGDHTFAVRALDGVANPSQAATYGWTVAVGNFSISGDLNAELFPGMDQAPLDLTFTNPYSFDVNVTSSGAGAVRVSVQQATFKGTLQNTACDGPTNVAVTQASGGWTVAVPAKSHMSLSQAGIPSAQWPQIQMVDLPSNQDGCKNTTFKFSYTGTATKK